MTPQMVMQMLNNGANPNALIYQMAQNNPIMQRAIQMTQGKSEEEIRQIVLNLAQQRGMDEAQLRQMAHQYGLTL